MKPESIISALEDALRSHKVRVRKGRGAFRGGLATVDGETVIVLNRMHPPTAQLVILAEALRELPVVETIYLRPAVRAALEDAWAEADAGVAEDSELATEE